MTDELREADAYKASVDQLKTEMEALQKKMMNSVPFYSSRYKVTREKYLANERSSQLCTQLKQFRKLKPAKNYSGLNGIRTHDRCDTGAVLIPAELSSPPETGHFVYPWM